MVSGPQPQGRNDSVAGVRLLAYACAFVGGALAVTAMIGWLLGETALTRLGTSGTPMRFNTAVAVLLTAFVIWRLAHDTETRAAWIALVPIAFAVITGVEIVTGVQTRLGELVVADRSGIGVPGQASPLTAVSLAALGLSLLGWRSGGSGRAMSARLVAATLALVISVAALVGYAADVPTYVWDGRTSMALQSSLALIALATAAMALAWRDARLRAGYAQWAPRLLFMSVAAIGTLLARAIVLREEALIADSVGARAHVAWLVFTLFLLLGAFAAHAYRMQVRLTSSVNELERANASLQQGMEEREAMQHALERSNRELSQFAHVASHDLQAPLRQIRAFADIIVNKHTADLPSDARDHLARIRSAVARMQALIEDLLIFSRVIMYPVPFKRVELSSVAREVISDLESQIESAGAIVRVEEPLPVVEADASQMRQLLQNLIGNALKFRRRDVAPVVSVSGDARAVGLDPDPIVALRVSDNGIGISQEDTERIFLPFERLNGRDEFEGTGLGLAICRRIVDRHDGVIDVASTPGKGTTFTIQLPARQRRREAA